MAQVTKPFRDATVKRQSMAPSIEIVGLFSLLLLRLLPTFRGQKYVFFFYLAKLKLVILSSFYKTKILKISKSGRVI